MTLGGSDRAAARRTRQLPSRATDREIARLALPALAALVAEPLFLLTDSAIVGHLGVVPLAGLGVASTVLATAVGISVFLAYGTTGAVARRLGAGDLTGALRHGVDGCWLAGGLGLLAAAVGWPLSARIVAAFDPTSAVADQADTYLRISLLGLPAMLVVLAGTGVLRGLQDTRTPLVVVVAGSALNVVLNLALVYGAGLGIAGSALGTVIAQAAMGVAFVLVVARAARAHRAPLRPHPAGVRRSFGAGVPLIVRTLAMRAVLLVATASAAALGTDALAAWQVSFTLWTFLALSLDAVAIAAQALVGRALGAGDVGQVRALTRRMVQWGVGSGVALGVLIVAARPLFVPWFSPDPTVVTLLAAALVVVAVQQPVAGWVFVLDGVLIGAGDGRYLALASIAATLAFAPAAWLVVHLELGLPGLWVAVAAWLLVRLVTLALRARGTAWMVTGAVR